MGTPAESRQAKVRKQLGEVRARRLGRLEHPKLKTLGLSLLESAATNVPGYTSSLSKDSAIALLIEKACDLLHSQHDANILKILYGLGEGLEGLTSTELRKKAAEAAGQTDVYYFGRYEEVALVGSLAAQVCASFIPDAEEVESRQSHALSRLPQHEPLASQGRTSVAALYELVEELKQAALRLNGILARASLLIERLGETGIYPESKRAAARSRPYYVHWNSQGVPYSLWRKDVTLRAGRRQTIYFFVLGEPGEGARVPVGTPTNLPHGYAVTERVGSGVVGLKKEAA